MIIEEVREDCHVIKYEKSKKRFTIKSGIEFLVLLSLLFL